ncbi:hypothetical protein B0H19DRAFT_1250510 [Mycena capillaripes]|nr:hypothetical protein B0H19DRAFT_1250510 [Mycena capillaripes]
MIFATFALIPLVIQGFPALVDSAIVSRAPGVFACVEPNFSGLCSIFNHTSGKCIKFAPLFNNNISSFSTDDRNCFIYLQGCYLLRRQPRCNRGGTPQ